MAGVWIVAEKLEYARELLNIAREVAPKMGVTVAVLLVSAAHGAQDCLNRGADRVLLLPDLPEDQALDAYLPLILAEVRKEDPDLVLLPATTRGKELAARLAAQLDTGLCSNCITMAYDEGAHVLTMERLAYGGAAVQRLQCLSRPAMATILPRSFESAPVIGEGRPGQITELDHPPESSIKIHERRAKQKATRDLTEAKVVVSVGRGMAKAEDLTLIRQLADALGGEIGGTRPITEELHWLPADACIGLSGVQVKPDLFLALGVSGQIQHVTGIRGAKVIAAVNRDENAPIFAVADFGITGDLYDVVPKLLDALGKT